MSNLIYSVLNVQTGKYYIGKTEHSLSSRWQGHLKNARKGAGYYFPRSIRKYGPEAFEVLPMFWGIASRDELDRLEKFFIWITRSNDPRFGYNQTDGGTGGIQSEDARRRQANAVRGNTFRKGKIVGPEGRARIKTSKQFISSETRRKIGLARLGKKIGPHSPEWCANISRALKGHPALHREGSKNPFFGKTHSAEARAKISAAKRGVKLGPRKKEAADVLSNISHVHSH
jgi:group I intron endonuclease